MSKSAALPIGNYVVFWDPGNTLVTHVSIITTEAVYDVTGGSESYADDSPPEPETGKKAKLKKWPLFVPVDGGYAGRSAWVIQLDLDEKKSASLNKWFADYADPGYDFLFHNCAAHMIEWVRVQYPDATTNVMVDVGDFTPFDLAESIFRRKVPRKKVFRWSGFKGDPNFNDNKIIPSKVPARWLRVQFASLNYVNIRDLIQSRLGASVQFLLKDTATKGDPSKASGGGTSP